MAKKRILELSTLVDRDTVVINGEEFDLRAPAEFSILEFHRIGKRAASLSALQAKDGLTDDEIGELSSVLDELCRLVLVAPDEVHLKLREGHKQAILGAFTDAAAEARGAVAAPVPQETTPDPPTGESVAERMAPIAELMAEQTAEQTSLPTGESTSPA